MTVRSSVANPQYYIELPEDDEVNSQPTQALEEIDEIGLASGFYTALALEKRKRDNQPQHKMEGGQGKQKLRVCNPTLLALPRMTVDTAEEAGLAMPPPPQ